jgi:hypothetical protein
VSWVAERLEHPVFQEISFMAALRMCSMASRSAAAVSDGRHCHHKGARGLRQVSDVARNSSCSYMILAIHSKTDSQLEPMDSQQRGVGSSECTGAIVSL